MELQEFLALLMTGGGAIGAAITFFVMERVTLDAEVKRYLSIGIPVALALIGYTGSVALGYVPSPGATQGWIEAVFRVLSQAFIGLAGSQAAHGIVYLNREARIEAAKTLLRSEGYRV